MNEIGNKIQTIASDLGVSGIDEIKVETTEFFCVCILCVLCVRARARTK